MKKFFPILILFLQVTWAENLCPVTESRGEGHFPISETMFTEQKAIESAEKLKEIIPKANEIDDFESAVKNNLVFIEGYMLKHNAIEAANDNKTYAKLFVKSWCDFLENDAHFWH